MQHLEPVHLSQECFFAICHSDTLQNIFYLEIVS